MPRFFDKYQKMTKLAIDDNRKRDLREWIEMSIIDHESMSTARNQLWKDCIRMYESVPKLKSRDVPIENAPNIEIPIGAISCDTIYAQSTDLIWNTSPLTTARPKMRDSLSDAEELQSQSNALQALSHHIATSSDVGLKSASNSAILDNIQLGTGMLYIPWVEKSKKTKTSKILSVSPRISAIAPEDIIVPSGTRHSINEMPFAGFTNFFTQPELNMLAKMNNWDISEFTPLGAQSAVRSQREHLGRQMEGIEVKGTIFDVQFMFVYYDIDGDGYDEDLLVIFNKSSGSIGHICYNPMDCRPFESMTYQDRAHLFYGLGVLEMIRPFQEKLSDMHNYATLNILLANSRVWLSDGTVPDNLRIWPGRVIQATGPDSLVPLQMADVYSSIYQDQSALMGLANQRVGMSDAMTPSSLPDRASGVSTMSVLQQVNRRFAPAFDSMRSCISRAVKQGMFRYQERILRGDAKAIESIFKILGNDYGNAALDILQSENFDEEYDIELSAASASVNREADRRDSLVLTQILGQYYQRTLELMTLAANPQTPPQVQEVALKISKAAGEVVDRTIRTFDTMRDPQSFIIEVDEELRALQEQQGANADTMGQLMGGLMQQQLGGAMTGELPEAPSTEQSMI